MNIAYIGSWKHFVSVFVCVCVSLYLYLSFCMSWSRSLSSPDDKLEHHTVEINGDVTMRTDGRPNKQMNIELVSQWTLWDWVSQNLSVSDVVLNCWSRESFIWSRTGRTTWTLMSTTGSLLNRPRCPLVQQKLYLSFPFQLALSSRVCTSWASGASTEWRGLTEQLKPTWKASLLS